MPGLMRPKICPPLIARTEEHLNDAKRLPKALQRPTMSLWRPSRGATGSAPGLPRVRGSGLLFNARHHHPDSRLHAGTPGSPVAQGVCFLPHELPPSFATRNRCLVAHVMLRVHRGGLAADWALADQSCIDGLSGEIEHWPPLDQACFAPDDGVLASGRSFFEPHCGRIGTGRPFSQ